MSSLKYVPNFARAAAITGFTLALASAYPAEAQRRQDTLIYHKSPYNGAENACVNGKCTNITSYLNGREAELKVRRLERENQLRNQKPIISINLRQYPKQVIVVRKR